MITSKYGRGVSLFSGVVFESNRGYSLTDARAIASANIENDPSYYENKIESAVAIYSRQQGSMALVLDEYSKGKIDRFQAFNKLTGLGATYGEAAAMMRQIEEAMELIPVSSRKKSKYNGLLVNECPPDQVVDGGIIGSAIYRAASDKSLVRSSISGSFDDFTLNAYRAGGGRATANVIPSGARGRVSGRFEAGTGDYTEFDLGGDLETGYVVSSLHDGLGVFPTGTRDGDFIEKDTVYSIFERQGTQDASKEEITSSFIRSDVSSQVDKAQELFQSFLKLGGVTLLEDPVVSSDSFRGSLKFDQDKVDWSIFSGLLRQAQELGQGVLDMAQNSLILSVGSQPIVSMVKAYHGSPAAFKGFSTKYIGRGEGNQAYGWGLYFAENPKVSTSWYMERLVPTYYGTDSSRSIENGGDVLKNYKFNYFCQLDGSGREVMACREKGSKWYAVRLNSVTGLEVSSVHDSATVVVCNILMGWVAPDSYEGPDADWVWMMTDPSQSSAEILTKQDFLHWAPKVGSLKQKDFKGNLYMVELDVDDSNVLNWDEDVSSQNELVQSVAKSLTVYSRGSFDVPAVMKKLRFILTRFPEAMNSVSPNKMKEFLERGAFGELLNYVGGVDKAFSAAVKDYLSKSVFNAEFSSGEGLYSRLVGEAEIDSLPDQKVFDWPAKAASLYLLSKGIRGIKYADGFSRSDSNDKTYNYVVFADKYIKDVTDQSTIHDPRFEPGELFASVKDTSMIKSDVSSDIAGIVKNFESEWGGSGSETRPPTEIQSLSELACLVTCVSADFHHMHFDVEDPDKWDRTHAGILQPYYEHLDADYDDIAELAKQVKEEVPNASLAAGYIGYTPLEETSYSYEEAVILVDERLAWLCGAAKAVNDSYGDGSSDSIGIQNYFGGFLEYWTKEWHFKNEHRLGDSSVDYPAIMSAIKKATSKGLLVSDAKGLVEMVKNWWGRVQEGLMNLDLFYKNLIRLLRGNHFDGERANKVYSDILDGKDIDEAMGLVYASWLRSDTEKVKGGYANIGKDGKQDSGKFKTKKEADDQRKAMYANGYVGSSISLLPSSVGASIFSATPTGSLGKDERETVERVHRLLVDRMARRGDKAEFQGMRASEDYDLVLAYNFWEGGWPTHYINEVFRVKWVDDGRRLVVSKWFGKEINIDWADVEAQIDVFADKIHAKLEAKLKAEGIITSSVVAKQDSIQSQLLSGQITELDAIDGLIESGMDYDDAEKLVSSWEK
jgi:DNA-binding ferritin-like protein